jgi:hypothetical protein
MEFFVYVVFCSIVLSMHLSRTTSSFVSALEPLSVPLPLLSRGKHVPEPCESSTLGFFIDFFYRYCILVQRSFALYLILILNFIFTSKLIQISVTHVLLEDHTVFIHITFLIRSRSTDCVIICLCFGAAECTTTFAFLWQTCTRTM